MTKADLLKAYEAIRALEKRLDVTISAGTDGKLFISGGELLLDLDDDELVVSNPDDLAAARANAWDTAKEGIEHLQCLPNIGMGDRR